MAFTFEEVYQELTNVKPDMSDIKENCLTIMDTGFYIAEYAEKEFYDLFKTIGVNEYAYFKKNGTVLLYEADDEAKGAFWANVKRFFINLWEKIKSVFQTVLTKIAQIKENGLAKKKNEIAKGFEKLLAEAAKSDGKKISGYPINPDDLVKRYNDVTANLDKKVISNDAGAWFTFSGIPDFKAKGKEGIGEYAKDLKDSLMGDKKDLTVEDLNKMKVDILRADTAKFAAALKKCYNGYKKKFAKVISEASNGKIDDETKQRLSDNKDFLVASNVISNTLHSVLLIYVNQIIKIEYACVRLAGKKEEKKEEAKETKNESVLFSFL